MFHQFTLITKYIAIFIINNSNTAQWLHEKLNLYQNPYVEIMDVTYRYLHQDVCKNFLGSAWSNDWWFLVTFLIIIYSYKYIYIYIFQTNVNSWHMKWKISHLLNTWICNSNFIISQTIDLHWSDPSCHEWETFSILQKKIYQPSVNKKCNLKPI